MALDPAAAQNDTCGIGGWRVPVMVRHNGWSIALNPPGVGSVPVTACVASHVFFFQEVARGLHSSP